MNKVDRHMDICKDLNKIYEHKNHDYGDSFHDTFVEEGMAMARIRLSDKLNRFKKLSRAGSEQNVNDESIRDTLLDLANYAIMTVMEMDILEEDDARTKLRTAIREHAKMKDEWGASNFYGKRFELHLDWRKDVICPRCGNVLAYDPEKSSVENDIYICERCGMLCLVDIEHGYTIPKTEDELKDQEKDEDPCIMCGKPTIDKAVCCKCPERMVWEKRQRGDTELTSNTTV